MDADVLTRKTQASLHHVRRLRDRAPLDPATLAGDEDLWNIVTMDLLQAIQPCIDLALHVVTHDSLGVPEGPASAFALLATAGRISKASSIEMARAAGLRNLIAHRYGQLEPGTIADAINQHLGSIETFLRELRSGRE